MKDLFLLRPDITFLNFGSFGACPKLIFDEYQRYQRELEYEPVQFIVNSGPRYLRESRSALASYLGTRADELVFVPNPTFAVNTIAKSLRLQEGDEILTTNLEYGACDKTWEYTCEKKGAKYVKQSISLPIRSKESFLEDFWSGFTENTRLVFLSQITSSTALILPVKEICEEARRRGVLVFIDGAHVLGHISLNIPQLGADYYTGACHKWMLTPKGSSFLFVKKELQAAIDPLVISWGYKTEFPGESQFLDYHQFNGTRDFSAYLTIPKAIAFLQEYQWDEVSEKCKELTRKWLIRLCKLVGSEPLAPVTDEFIGQMGSIPIRCADPLALKQVMYDEYRIEIPVPVHNGEVYLRFSVNAFNDEADLVRLEEVMKDLIRRKYILINT